jgi:hypothetical protein
MSVATIMSIEPVKTSKFSLCAAILIAILALLSAPLEATASDGRVYTGQVQKNGTYFQRHPRVRKAAKAAGIGALTGGLGATILGGSIVVRAITGAGVRAGVTTAKDSKFFKKFRRR